MITITYDNDETEQEMIVKIKDCGDGTSDVSLEFIPEATVRTSDPADIMAGIMDMITNLGKRDEQQEGA